MIKEKIRSYIHANAKVDWHDNIASFAVPASEIVAVVSELYANKNLSLKLITATDERTENDCFKVWYVFAYPKENVFIVPFLELKNITEFPSLSNVVHSAWSYEKKIKTFFGLNPIGHLDTRPIILHENWPVDVYPLRKDFAWNAHPQEAQGTYQFQKTEGEGIYEIPVGPIHAGIIEPGHFRFSVAGESIVYLESRLGYTHKGSEKLFETLSIGDKINLSEKISGDSSFSHSLAFCQTLEKLNNTVVPARARYLRVIYAELERLANHFGDIGAIMMDTGFNFGGAQGSRLREMLMQINERLTSSRFLRGVNTIGGVTKDIADSEKNKLRVELKDISQDFAEVMQVAENSTSLLNRLKGTGILSLATAQIHDATGVVGKAVGITKDARIDYLYAAYGELSLGEIITELEGDVYARFHVRVKEVYESIKIIVDALEKLPKGDINIQNKKIVFTKNTFSISIVEGWRGEIVYFVTTDANGNISRVVPRDPSFINWAVLGEAGINNVVPDFPFPLINKSFNLSYSGNDL